MINYPPFKKVGDELQGNSTATDHTRPIAPNPSEASEQKEPVKLKITKSIVKNFDDGTFEITHLEINGEKWVKAVEHGGRPSVVTQSEKGADSPRDFLIMNYGWIEQAVDNGMDIRLDEIEILSVMSAYAKSERSRAIDECQETVNSHMGSENLTARILVGQMEKLKSRQ